MSKVIEIENRIESEKRKKKIADRRRQLAPLIHFLQCSGCRMKCWRCGSQVEELPADASTLNVPFNLCKNCRDEYLEYQLSKENAADKEILWHNSEWEAMWEKWIDYQTAVQRFHRSQEVRDLFKDLRC